MTDHLRRIREHMKLETRALLLEADRARLLDNTTNRGSEAEHSVRRWLSARFAPAYTVSSGEVIDSFDTNAALRSRQQDGLLHINSADANRFLLPSGQRLLPIETVAAVVEVKLTLTKEEFDKANAAAEETSRLRLRPHPTRSTLPILPGESYGKTVDGVHVVDRVVARGCHPRCGIPCAPARSSRAITRRTSSCSSLRSSTRSRATSQSTRRGLSCLGQAARRCAHAPSKTDACRER